MWFARKVVDGLCEVLDEHLAVERMEGARVPAAIGSVPWLSSDDIVDRLLQMWCCIVVDKNDVRWVPDRFINGPRRMPNTVLPDDFPLMRKDLVEIRLEHG